MPGDGALHVLVLNGSLKHEPDISNTEEVVQDVLKNMGTRCQIHSEIVRLADKKLPVGLGFRESSDDEWPEIVQKIKKSDIVIFATPIWWGGRSSLLQRVIERLDALDEEYHASGRSALYNKIAGVVITGSEDSKTRQPKPWPKIWHGIWCTMLNFSRRIRWYQRSLKNFLTIFVSLSFLLGISHVHAVSFEDPSGSLGLGTTDFKIATLKATQLILGLLGIILIALFLIYVGFNFLWSGRSDKVRGWTWYKGLKPGLIGLIIILLSWAIVSYVLSTLENVTN